MKCGALVIFYIPSVLLSMALLHFKGDRYDQNLEEKKKNFSIFLNLFFLSRTYESRILSLKVVFLLFYDSNIRKTFFNYEKKNKKFGI